MTVRQAMGLDIGGSGVKAAVVDIERGQLIGDRVRQPTPRPATPEAVLMTAATLRRELGWSGPVGCGFPGSLERGKVTTAPNLDSSWIGRDLAEQLGTALRSERVAIGNDADAAGLAEMRFGAGRGVTGTVVVVTLGTGIGTSVFRDGLLLPGTELGHLEIDGEDAERLASSSARKSNDWTWTQWADGVDRYLAHLGYLLGVDQFIIGGGVSKKPHKFLPHLTRVGCGVVAATLGNQAGIVGAALLVAESVQADGEPQRKSGAAL